MAEDLNVISLDGNLTIDRGTELRDTVQAALNNTQRLFLDLSHVTGADMSFFHLLYAAQKEATALGKEIHLSGAITEELRGLFVTGGFCKEAPATGRELEAVLIEFLPSGGEADEAGERVEP